MYNVYRGGVKLHEICPKSRRCCRAKWVDEKQDKVSRTHTWRMWLCALCACVCVWMGGSREQRQPRGFSCSALIDFSLVNPDLDFVSPGAERRLTKAWQVLWSYFPPEGKRPFSFSWWLGRGRGYYGFSCGASRPPPGLKPSCKAFDQQVSAQLVGPAKKTPKTEGDWCLVCCCRQVLFLHPKRRTRGDPCKLRRKIQAISFIQFYWLYR